MYLKHVNVNINIIGELKLSYHRRLRMILVALEFRVESGRVSHSWCRCVVSHGYGGLGGGRDGGGGWYVCDTKPRFAVRMSRDAGAFTDWEVIH